MKKIILIVFLIAGTVEGFTQKETKLIRQGNRLYKQGQYKQAEMNYRKALEIDKESVKGKFNLGTSVYQQKNYNESSKIFQDLTSRDIPKPVKAEVLHNLGNSLLEAKQYEQSIAAYKNSLLNDPSDKDTKYNLEYAKKMLKNQQQQQQKQNQDKNKKDQDKKDQEKKDQQNKDQNKDQSKNQQQDQNKKISKEDAERMLEALKNDEKKTMEKVKKEKAKVQPVTIEKDW